VHAEQRKNHMLRGHKEFIIKDDNFENKITKYHHGTVSRNDFKFLCVDLSSDHSRRCFIIVAVYIQTLLPTIRCYRPADVGHV